MLREQKDGWCWQEPNGVEGLEDRGWAVGSLIDHGTKCLDFILRPQEVFGGL